eukprot:TRINITY_DN5407_c2_g1_i1.p1 TRINITY_DN5407_c2_g1~~TRINITY_DN5407_c2_g1_i1.p1  ORF type:complete len:575 (+),score=34.57 TRINITY_DN5407_c2_g1_i1:101-1726(+)
MAGALGARRDRSIDTSLIEQIPEDENTCCGSCRNVAVYQHITTSTTKQYYCSSNADQCCWSLGKKHTYWNSFWVGIASECGPGTHVDLKTPPQRAYPCCDSCATLHTAEYHSTSTRDYYYSKTISGECCWWNDCNCPQRYSRDTTSNPSVPKLDKHINTPAGVLPCITKEGSKLRIKSCAVLSNGDSTISEGSYVHACREVQSQTVCMIANFQGHGGLSLGKFSQTAATLFLDYFMTTASSVDSSFVEGMVKNAANYFMTEETYKDYPYENVGCTASGFLVNLNTAGVTSFNLGNSRTLLWETGSEKVTSGNVPELKIHTTDHDSSSKDHLDRLLNDVCTRYEIQSQAGEKMRLSSDEVERIKTTCETKDHDDETKRTFLKDFNRLHVSNVECSTGKVRIDVVTRGYYPEDGQRRASRSLGDNVYGELIDHTPDIWEATLAQKQGSSHSFVIGSASLFDTYKTDYSVLHEADNVNKAIVNDVDSVINEKASVNNPDKNIELFQLAKDLTRRSEEARKAESCAIRTTHTTAIVGLLEPVGTP